MTPRSDSPTPAAPDESLHGGADGRRLPELPVKRATAAVLAAALVAALLLPWWRAGYPMRDVVDELAGWQLLQIGLGIGELPALTRFSVLGNVLFGALPLVPLVVLAALLLARALRPRAVQGRLIVVWGVLVVLAIGWLLALGWARLNATFGEHPALPGMLVAAMASLFAAIAFGNWWRRGERDLYPRRGRLSLAPEPEPLLDADGREVTAERLFDEEEADADEPAGDAVDGEPDEERERPAG